MPVYFIRAATLGLIKIGKANSVSSRLADLQIGSPDTLTVLAVIENESSDHLYHNKFEADRVRGEWFRPSDQLMNFIASIPKDQPKGKRSAVKTRAHVPVSREWLANEVLNSIQAAKPGSYAQLGNMRLYAKLRGWKSWKDVPEFTEMQIQQADATANKVPLTFNQRVTNQLAGLPRYHRPKPIWAKHLNSTATPVEQLHVN